MVAPVSAPKRIEAMTPFERKLHTARVNDANAAAYARNPQHGPLDDEEEPDAYDLMMNAPYIMDFEPCGPDCESTCPCRRRPADEDT
jgi:hypothetical protein